MDNSTYQEILDYVEVLTELLVSIEEDLLDGNHEPEEELEIGPWEAFANSLEDVIRSYNEISPATGSSERIMELVLSPLARETAVRP